MLLARVEHRSPNELREPQVSLVLNEDIRTHRSAHEELIDTTQLSPAEVASRLLEILQRPA